MHRHTDIGKCKLAQDLAPESDESEIVLMSLFSHFCHEKATTTAYKTFIQRSGRCFKAFRSVLFKLFAI